MPKRTNGNGATRGATRHATIAPPPPESVEWSRKALNILIARLGRDLTRDQLIDEIERCIEAGARFRAAKYGNNVIPIPASPDTARRPWLARLTCFFGSHRWIYSDERDAIGRPIRRLCATCQKVQYRRYSSLARGGYGLWET